MMSGAVAHALNPSAQEEAEAGRSLSAQGQPSLHTSSGRVEAI